VLPARAGTKAAPGFYPCSSLSIADKSIFELKRDQDYRTLDVWLRQHTPCEKQDGQRWTQMNSDAHVNSPSGPNALILASARLSKPTNMLDHKT
jgi:hypothetical protein